MKKNLLSICSLFIAGASFAQCTFDPQYSGMSGNFFPDSATFIAEQYAEGGVAYEGVVSIVTIADTLSENPFVPGQTFTIYIDALKIESVTGLPAGFGYAEGGTTFDGTKWNNGGSGTSTTPVEGYLAITAAAADVAAAAPATGHTDYPINVLVDARISGTDPDLSSIIANGTWLSGLGAIGLGSLPVNDYVIRVHAGCQPTYSTTTVSECANYTWNGATYFQSGTYNYQTTNAENCDSIATLELTILPNVQEFESYTLCDGESVTVNGTTYTQSGQYSQLISGNNSCDTSLTLNIQSDWAPGVSILGNTSIAGNTAETYAFVDPGGYNIVWSAINGTVISGQGTAAANIFWNAIGGGEVSVTLSNNNCSYTYTMAVGNFVGVEDHWINDLQIHPNPSTGIFNMELTEPTLITVMDARGRKIMETNGNGQFSLDLNGFSKGTYILQVQSSKGLYSEKLILQ